MPKEEKHDVIILQELVVDLINSREWEKARVVGEYLTTIIPEDHEMHEALGMVWLGLNDLDKAEQCVRRALALGAKNTQNFLLIAHVCAYRGDLEGQLQWAKQAVDFDAKDAKPHFVIADAHLRLGQLTEAEASLKRIIEINSKDLKAHSMLGDIYLLLSRLDEAENEFCTALNLDEDNASLWADLGHTLSRMKKHEEALLAFRKALYLQPDNPTRHYNVGDTYLAMGQPDNAVAFLGRSVQLDPDYALAHYDLGLAFFELGKYEESAVASSASLRNDPEMSEQRTNLGLGGTNNLGLSYLNLGKYGEAEKCFRRNLKLVGSSYFNLGLALFKQGRYEEALVNFSRAVELEPNNPEYLDLVGNAYAELGRLNEAREALQKAIDLDKSYALAHYDMGTVLARMEGQQEQAIKSFETAIENNPDLAPAYYGIACIYALWKKKELALHFFEKALQKGFRDKTHIEKDSDLDFLKDDSKFCELKALYLSKDLNDLPS